MWLSHIILNGIGRLNRPFPVSHIPLNGLSSPTWGFLAYCERMATGLALWNYALSGQNHTISGVATVIMMMSSGSPIRQ